MKIFIWFGAILAVTNARILNSNNNYGGNNNNGDTTAPLEGHVETIRVIQEHGGHVPQYQTQGVSRGHVETVRVVQENGNHIHNGDEPAFGGHVNTVRVIQENSRNIHNEFGGGTDTIRVIQDNGFHIHDGVDHSVGSLIKTIRVIQDAGTIGSAGVGVSGHSVYGRHIETIRVIEDNGGRNIHNGGHGFHGGPAIGGGHNFTDGPTLQTIRLIQEDGGEHNDGSSALGGPVDPLSPVNNGHVETIRVIQDNVVNHLRSDSIGASHPVDGHIQTIRVIQVNNGHHLTGGTGHIEGGGDHIGTIRLIKEHNVDQPNSYNYGQSSHSPEGHTNIIKIIAATAGAEIRHD